MKTDEWFVLEETPARTVEIRAWMAGDGLSCSFRTARSKISCGAPVAVLKTVVSDRDWRRGGEDRKRVRTSLVCEHHIANTLSGACYRVAGITTEADKEAREAILAAHWEEYQEELVRRVKEKKEAQLSKLPDSLREAFAKVAEVSSDD